MFQNVFSDLHTYPYDKLSHVSEASFYSCMSCHNQGKLSLVVCAQLSHGHKALSCFKILLSMMDNLLLGPFHAFFFYDLSVHGCFWTLVSRYRTWWAVLYEQHQHDLLTFLVCWTLSHNHCKCDFHCFLYAYPLCDHLNISQL